MLDESALAQLEGWIDDYFYRALDWISKTADHIIETTKVGVTMNGLSHLAQVRTKGEFVCALSRGLGANINFDSKIAFAKEVFQWAQESHPDARRPLNTYCDSDGRLSSYQLQVSNNSFHKNSLFQYYYP